jgi:N6-L-threonylcarbamoyladenine synthase
MTKPAASLTILALESSCDDTAAAVLRHAPGGRPEVLGSVVLGQIDLHRAFGGVVPEIAARAHAERMDICVERALGQAGLPLGAIDAIAVTAGPGLIGGLLAGVMCAKGLAMPLGLPLIGVNHLAGHALSPQLAEDVPFPYLILLVSGGHCQFLLAQAPDRFRRLGGTIDDAPGEAFDKVAKLLGLGQPGGPEVEAAARSGDPTRFALPRPLLDRPGMDLSFSGLKTAVLRERDRLVAAQGGLREQDRADLCAAFQAAVADVLVEKSRRAIAVYKAEKADIRSFCVAGGVAANATIRARLSALAGGEGCRFIAPPMAFCTDNAVMIGWAAMHRARAGEDDGPELSARARWPLDSDSSPMLGFGKRGAKA